MLGARGVSVTADEGAEEPPRDVRDHLAVYGYGTLRDMIRSRRIYARCAALGRPVTPTSHELELLSVSADERHVLAAETLLKVLQDPEKVWATWDVRKGAALETYFVNALVQRFTTVFRQWQNRRRVLGQKEHAVTVLPSRASSADPVFNVMARDLLERALRTAEPDVRALLALTAAGCSHREMADRLQISERAVEGRLHRFRKQIRTSGVGRELRDVLVLCPRTAWVAALT